MSEPLNAPAADALVSAAAAVVVVGGGGGGGGAASPGVSVSARLPGFSPE